jgi:hypothetical protein
MTATARTIESAPSIGRGKLWTGRVLSALPVLLMLFSASMKLVHSPEFLVGWTGKFGYPEGAATAIGLVELACVVLYVVPRTAILGAILLTGYLGGAVATHVRIGDPSAITPLLVGVLAWAGLYLREPSLHALLPLRKSA